MKFFLDTANLDQIKTANSWGIVDGITTNPSLVAKEDQAFEELIKQICEIVDGPISAEVVSLDSDSMMEEARNLAKLHKNVVVKIPFTREGLKAIKAASLEGIRINTTLIFSANQALMAAKAGAAYVSPFIGRLDDISHYGSELIAHIREIYDNYNFECEILAASIRHPLHVVEVARMGADVATVPFAVLDKMFVHPLTDIGLDKFMADWKKSQEQA